MRTRLFILCIALMATLRLFSVNDYTINGISYTKLGGDSVEVGKNTNAKGAIIIPEMVMTYRVVGIGDAAFLGCTGLTSVTIPNSVTSIGISAFYGCSSLPSITIPNSVTSIGSYAFRGCTGLTFITIPNSVISIGDYAFYGCTGLSSITIPNSLTNIGEYTFKGCTSLTSVTIGESVSEIGKSAFESCNSLTSVVWNAINCANFIIPYAPFPNSVTSFTFGEKVEHVPANLCYNMSVLTSVMIPNSVTSIGSSAFRGCSSLTSVSIPEGVTSIAGFTFNGCSNLTSVTIPNSVTSIGAYAFFECGNLTSITIPDGVTSIESVTFCGCSSLTSVMIPNSVTSIGSSAFQGCSSLTSVSIPEGVTSIGYCAFWGCSSLTFVAIPNGIKRIGDWAFAECSSLTSIELLTSLSSIGYETFRGCSKLTDIYVQCGDLAIVQQREGDSRLKYKPLPYTISTIVTNGSVSVPQNICDEMELTANPDYGYHFVQWSDGNTENPRSIELTKDTVFSAEFAPNIYSFSATCNENCGSVQATNGNYEYLTELTISATPKSGYHFVQWSDGDTTNPKIVILTQDTTLTAEFAINQYTITWKQDDGTTINQTTVEYGQVPTHENVTKEATVEFTYAFAGWTPEIVVVTEDATYTATYTSTRNRYTITWKQDDGTTIDQTIVEYGQVPTHENASKDATAEYTYTFAGWTPEIVAVTGDATYAATYNSIINKYTITFKNEDGSVLCVDEWEYGTLPSCEEPKKEDDEKYMYTFAGWYPEVETVNANATYTATYTATQMTDGIEDVHFNDIAAHKIVIDGQIYILRGEKIYTIQGQKVK